MGSDHFYMFSKTSACTVNIVKHLRPVQSFGGKLRTDRKFENMDTQPYSTIDEKDNVSLNILSNSMHYNGPMCVIKAECSLLKQFLACIKS